ncbi:hypothetical protein B0H14DRAFT_2561710 [Mycena olivaceomarginata]|nr:hypothetical protein B0H14DRAFT_2561710 [Mycena olivaceomarginata]
MCAVKNARTASATESVTPLDAQRYHVRVSPVLSHFQVEERISTVSSRTTRTPQPPSTFSLPVSFLRSFQCAEASRRPLGYKTGNDELGSRANRHNIRENNDGNDNKG